MDSEPVANHSWEEWIVSLWQTIPGRNGQGACGKPFLGGMEKCGKLFLGGMGSEPVANHSWEEWKRAENYSWEEWATFCVTL
jgi:hypothetical protein